ncbi:hypothetical protein AAEP93_007639 [Penicillium crustosum]
MSAISKYSNSSARCSNNRLSVRLRVALQQASVVVLQLLYPLLGFLAFVGKVVRYFLQLHMIILKGLFTPRKVVCIGLQSVIPGSPAVSKPSRSLSSWSYASLIRRSSVI